MGSSVSPCLQVLGVVGKGSSGRGLHSSTFQLNVSALCGIGVAFRGCPGGVEGVSGAVRWYLGCVISSETAQVVLKSGRV